MRVGLRWARMSVSTKAAPHSAITEWTASASAAWLAMSFIRARLGSGWSPEHPMTITLCVGNLHWLAKASAWSGVVQSW